MTGFGGQQAAVKTGQILVQQGRDQGKALTGARFYKGSDHQEIHQSVRIRGAHMLPQTAGVPGCFQAAPRNVPRKQNPLYLLEVPELLPCQARHPMDKVSLSFIPEHQGQGR